MDRLPPWVYTTIAVTVTFGWFVSVVILDPLLESFAVDPGIHLVMGAVAGGAGVGGVISRRERGE